MNSSPKKIVSLFTGAGGLDLGFESAGFETSVAVEIDDKCVRTLRFNRDWPIIHKDIHDVSSNELLEKGELKKGEAHVLIGGPPCQPFSKSGFWATGETKRLEDPRAKTLDEYLRVLRATLPQAFLLENVAGLSYKGKSEGFQYILDRVAEINKEEGTNYQVQSLRVNAARYGVPQIRERVLLIAHRDGKLFGELLPTHAWGKNRKEISLNLPSRLLEPTTAWDAIGHMNPDLEGLSVKGKWAELLPSIPEGQNYLYHTDRGDGKPLFGWRRRYWNFLLKLSKDKPSWTLTAQPGPSTGPFHWDSRHLAMEELAALQTFPSNYVVLGSRIDVQKQIGNAVPSALAEIVALKMRSRFFDELEFESSSATLIPRKRAELPESITPSQVPSKFLELIGEHEPHPGTGMGYGAERLNASY